MDLAPAEIGIIVVGAAVGYWIVSYFLERGKPGSADSPRQDDAGPAEAPRLQGPWWAILDVAQDASRDEIAGAYKKRISEYHPDKVAHMGEEIRAVAARRAQEINAAYDEALRQLR